MATSSSQTPEIIVIDDRQLTGINMNMSITNNKTGELWRKMMTSIISRGSVPPKEKISLQVYPSDYFNKYEPTREFTKWALVEFEEGLSNDFQQFELKGGLYAVFNHIGSASNIFRYIYSTWLPQSDYTLDNRPHFEVLGEKYKNNDPKSEEKVWIPIRRTRRDDR